MEFRALISAFRLRTLPLALSSTLLGSFLALAHGGFCTHIFILTCITTLLLQILSNLANDYGDTIKGVDNENRVGPQRTVQSGRISKQFMRILIIIFAILSFISGSLLIFYGLKSIQQIIIFYALGVVAILAAIKYTVGKNPYGYVGLGDFFVFLFFGLIGVVGSYYLHVNTYSFWLLLPASSIGLLSTAVLNLNNMRDIENDTASGKKTLVVRIGFPGAKYYHTALLLAAIILCSIYALVFFNEPVQFIYLLAVPLFLIHLLGVLKNSVPDRLDKELKKLAIFTFIFSILFGLGAVL